MQELVGSSDFADLVAVLQRVRRIVPEGTEAPYDAGKLTEPAEVVLHEAVQKVGQAPAALADFVAAASVLVEPVTTFFDEILVMAEDPDLRAARLGPLATISALAAPVLDWQALGTASARPSDVGLTGSGSSVVQSDQRAEAFTQQAIAVGPGWTSSTYRASASSAVRTVRPSMMRTPGSVRAPSSTHARTSSSVRPTAFGLPSSLRGDERSDHDERGFGRWRGQSTRTSRPGRSKVRPLYVSLP